MNISLVSLLLAAVAAKSRSAVPTAIPTLAHDKPLTNNASTLAQYNNTTMATISVVDLLKAAAEEMTNSPIAVETRRNPTAADVLAAITDMMANPKPAKKK
ncbi:hypothetical protein DSO57_1019185 [Entomophthora muscae]|uniref:Uncharacterized protein n=1 Tax=Entomophthora muscae TaxID=34485 RepID=A0ACC2SH57_9FUNG|nr:hypothetical protein DSO57_1019185 [Entomophthora muscae]